MKKDGRKKLMPFFVTMILLLSFVVLLPQSAVAATTLTVTNDGDPYGLTPGDGITVEVTDGSLTPDERYTLYCWNDVAGEYEKLADKKADARGDLSVDIEVPGWGELGENPIGTHTLYLNDSNGDAVAGATVDIEITNFYKIKIFVDGSEVDDYTMKFNYSYDFTVRVYNYSDGDWDEVTDQKFDFQLHTPDGVNDTFAGNEYYWIANIDYEFDYIEAGGNVETVYWLNVTNDADNTRYSNQSIYVKPNVAVTASDVGWNDNVQNVQVKITDYQDTPHNINDDYLCSVWAPVLDGYVEVQNDLTTSGFASMTFTTSDYSAGTWYVGTYMPGSTYRIDETDDLNIPDFIAYDTFIVGTDDSAYVVVEDPDEVIAGFNQTINISVWNDWNDEYYDEMWLQFQGLDCVYDLNLDGNIDSSDYHEDLESDQWVTLGSFADLRHGYKANGDKAYYQFTIRFNETGTGTIRVTYPFNESDYQDNDNDNVDQVANISGETSITVVEPDDINVIITGPPTAVVLDQVGNNWQNDTNPPTTIDIYGSDDQERMNATILITGCGLDIEIEEHDESYWVADGQYVIALSPKTRGTLTFTVTNETDEYTTSKDYEIDGLVGSATSSAGDDLMLTVEQGEVLNVYVEIPTAIVHVTHYDSNWDNGFSINFTTGHPNTEGAGKEGLFNFEITDEDMVDDDDPINVGYIVVAAESSGLFFYEIFEVVPDHDLVIGLINPTAGNDTLTVGLETEIIIDVTVEGTGDYADDIDQAEGVMGELLDDEGEVVQTFYFEDDGDNWRVVDQIIWWPGELVITATNNTDGLEHDGNITLMVEPASITFTPGDLTAAIEGENISIAVETKDALGNPFPEDTRLYLNLYGGDGDTDVDHWWFDTDEDGAAEFEVECVGDEEGYFNITLQDDWATVGTEGNETEGRLTISFPNFAVNPETAYVNIANRIEITATDAEGNPIEGLNLTLRGNPIEQQPDPVETGSDGSVEFDIQPLSSGDINITIARNISYAGGILVWDNVDTSTTIEVKSLQTLTVEVSQSPIYEGDTLTVTVTSQGNAVADADVSFGQQSEPTDSDGIVTFTVPDPEIESAVYKVTATKTGYISDSEDVTVIKKYDIILTSTEAVAGETFTVTVTAKGAALAGASVSVDGGTAKISDGNGKVTFTAGEADTIHTITATYGNYEDGTLSVTVKAGSPGFELLTLIAAIGIAFILLRRRRK